MEYTLVSLSTSTKAMLSKQSIEKYREIYRKQFGVDISEDDAAEQANRLLNLARVVLQPMPKAWEKRYNELLREKRKVQ
jgi:aldehyde:ferredoxin oxidoreductase